MLICLSLMNKVPEKLEDPGKFLIPCALQELNRTSALADFGASINLLPHSIYKKLGLEALTPTRRPFISNRKALIDLYEETLTLRVGKEELVYYADKSEKNKEKNFVHAISIIDFSKDDPFSGSTTNTLPPSSSPVKTSDNFEKFADELAPLNSFTTGTIRMSRLSLLLPSHLLHRKKVEFEAYLERDSILPGIDLTLPPTLEISSSNPTSPTLTGEKICSWKTPMFFSLVHFVWKMMTHSSAIRKKINCLLATYLHQKPKPLSQEVEEIKEKEDAVSNECLKNVVLNDYFYQSKKMLSLNVEDVNSFTFIIWIFLPYFTYTKESPLIIPFRSENFVFDPGIVTFHFLILETGGIFYGKFLVILSIAPPVSDNLIQGD
ncbi:reverse transcriptase domain-containing protein [Tanacetum coccineum]